MSSNHEPWEPLEGTPEAFNELAKSLGVNTRRWGFVHVLGLDLDLLACVPPGVLSLILLYPTTDDIEEYLCRQVPSSLSLPSDVFFVRQTVGGTCGTIAVLHALVNSMDALDGDADVRPDSVLFDILRRRKRHGGDLDEDTIVKRRSQYVIDSEAIRDAHQAACDVAAGASPSCAAGKRQGRHFITFVHIDGCLVELNGRCPAPVYRGATSAATFLRDAATEVRAIFAAVKDPAKQHQFGLLALVACKPECVE